MDDYMQMQVENLIMRINEDPFWLSNKSESIRSNKTMMLKVLEGLNDDSSQFFLNYLYENLTNDKEVVLACVKKSGMNLQYASEHIKNDKEIVFAAITNNSNATIYIGKNLKQDIAGRDPFNYFELYFLQERLQKIVPNKVENNNNKNKI